MINVETLKLYGNGFEKRGINVSFNRLLIVNNDNNTGQQDKK